VKVIKNAYLVDGTGKKPVKDVSILIKGNAIEEIGKTVDASSGAEVIEADGKTVMPGLIDAHVHICSNGDPNPPKRLKLLSRPRPAFWRP